MEPWIAVIRFGLAVGRGSAEDRSPSEEGCDYLVSDPGATWQVRAQDRERAAVTACRDGVGSAGRSCPPEPLPPERFRPQGPDFLPCGLRGAGVGMPEHEMRGDRVNYRRIATFTGWLWIITFVTSIAARFFFYAPVLNNQGNYVTGAGSDAQTLIAIGALLELLLIISNVGTAVVPYSIHKRVHEAGAVAYVAARLVECTFIAIGIVCMLAISTLRQDALSGTDAALGQGIFAVYEWTFRIGPGVIVGVGNGLILGWLMYTSGLVPPRLALFGLVGGPLIIISGALVILNVIEAGGTVQALMTIPEFIWELGIGIYLIVKGYRTSSPALAGTQEAAV